MQSGELAYEGEARQRSLLDLSLLNALSLDWEKALFVSIMVLAAISRFWDLGARALHHDESLHAVYSYYLYTGRGYVHDPLLHGTFIYHFNALIYFLFGASDASARYAPAFLGTLTVGLPYLLRRQMGRLAALLACGLLLISPSFLYFGRFIREDAHVAFFTLAMFVCIWRYLDERRPVYLYVLSGLLALSFNTKETTYLVMAVWGLFFFVWTGPELLALFKRERHFGGPADVLLLLGTLTLTQLGGFAIIYRRLQGRPIDAYPTPEEYRFLAVVFVLLLAVAALIGTRWRARVWLTAAGVFFAVFTIFFTTMFSNPAGFITGAVGGLVYWLAQQEVRRGGQPWYYYLLLLPLYEYLLLAFALPGIAYFLVKRRPFTSFLVFWFAGALVLFSWAGEKMPWLILQLGLPLALLAAMALAAVLQSQRWRDLARARALLVGAAVVLLVVGLALSNMPRPTAAGLSDLQSQNLWLRWLLMVGLLAAFAYLVLRVAERLGLRRSLGTLAVGSLVVLVPLTVHTGVQAAFVNGDVATEMIVYTQTTPDVVNVMQDIERVAVRTGQGKNLKVAYDSDVSWPFEWYLRDWPGRVFIGTGSPPTDAAVVIVGLENNHDAQVRPLLAGNYVSQRYRLRWWFPEDYRTVTEWLRAVTPEAKRATLPADTSGFGFLDILRASLRSDARTRLWRYFLYREPLDPLGSTDFVLYVRKDLVGGAWMPAQAATAAGVGQDPYANKTTDIAPSRTIAALPGAGTLNDPKGVAPAPDGGLYVLDSGNDRVVRLAADGQVLAQWGSRGKEPGQFDEPWGIAVDGQGNVYVSDTWNYRVQKFDASGRFLLQWGSFADARGQPGSSPGLFYGPRGLAVDREGNVLVVDTGNKRVQKFSPDGAFISQFGTFGAGDGQLNEPVGIALDAQGSIYLADTWNQRIQKFGPDYNYLAQWDVPSWSSEGVANKPYLAVDAVGNVYASDPEGQRLLKFANTGELLAVWGANQGQMPLYLPLGLAVDGQGNLYVADSGNNRVVVYPTPK